MPFDARYQESTEAEIIGNIFAVVTRDMKDALDQFWPGDNLPDFALKTDGEIDEFQFPLLVLGLQRTTSTETSAIDEGDYLDQTITVGAGLVVASETSLKTVRELMRKYVKSFKAVLRSAAASDLLPATARILNHSIDINHRWLRPYEKDAVQIQGVEFEIKFTFGES